MLTDITDDVAFDKALAVGQLVDVAWTEAREHRRGRQEPYRFTANARVTKVNVATVRAVLLERANGWGREYPIGHEVRVPRWPWSRWPRLGVFPAATYLLKIIHRDGSWGSSRLPDYATATSLQGSLSEAKHIARVEILPLPAARV